MAGGAGERDGSLHGVRAYSGLNAGYRRTPVRNRAQDAILPYKTLPQNYAVDAYRGFVMLLMMAEVLQLSHVARAYPGNWFWHVLAYNQTHVDGRGVLCTIRFNPDFRFWSGSRCRIRS